MLTRTVSIYVSGSNQSVKAKNKEALNPKYERRDGCHSLAMAKKKGGHQCCEAVCVSVEGVIVSDRVVSTSIILRKAKLTEEALQRRPCNEFIKCPWDRELSRTEYYGDNTRALARCWSRCPCA